MNDLETSFFLGGGEGGGGGSHRHSSITWLSRPSRYSNVALQIKGRGSLISLLTCDVCTLRQRVLLYTISFVMHGIAHILSKLSTFHSLRTHFSLFHQRDKQLKFESQRVQMKSPEDMRVRANQLLFKKGAGVKLKL